MAKMDISIPDELVKQLDTLGSEAADVAKEMVEAGGEVLLQAIKSKAPVKTGGLKRSIKRTGGHADSEGIWYDNIRFTGYDGRKTKKSAKGTSYAEIAQIYEYGTPRQPARPFVKPVISQSSSAVKQAMQDVYDRRSKK